MGYVLAAATFWFAGRYFDVNRLAFLSAIQSIPYSALVFAMLAFALQAIVNAFAFGWLNRSLGTVLSARTLAYAWMATLLAKYVPGGIWHVVGRGLVLERKGVPARTSALAGALEQAVSLGFCAAIAILFLCIIPSAAWYVAALFGLVCVAIAALLPRLVTALGVDMAPSTAYSALAAYGAAMIPYALGYLVIADPARWSQFVGAIFAGTTAGVLAIPVPGGLGVREAAIASLAEAPASGHAFAGLIAARVLIFVVEVVLSVASGQLLRRRDNR